ncbi:DNA-deoxyinosine glycosylase [Aquitalea magnusonii]|uniref:G/U mismatch-specific uracil-DNA glycosylase n=1 Tax=Aquitalea magnusonii TaxID=332411 RepID=A0A318JXU7_9NEIS|nr:DNA-deoxyinosine glycosylase [Aquitalea magnusonii]PXX50376.1 G/U mismatch-specific uracil-DNA glycosylase [Aquitalea magnusonii]
MSDSAKSCFPPVVNAQTRLLILGSLPGDASLRAAQYYAHPRNQFWRLLGELLDDDLPGLDYPSRLAALQQHGIGLWDVVAQARRPGSLDAAIRDLSPNDLPALCASLPALRAIAFNGGTAASIGRKQLAGMVSQPLLFDLPSSSPAYTLSYPAKLSRWLALRAVLA